MSIVPVAGLFETHLTVSDLDRSIAFYRDVVGLPLAHRVPARGVMPTRFRAGTAAITSSMLTRKAV